MSAAINASKSSAYHDNPTLDRIGRHTLGRVVSALKAINYVGTALGLTGTLVSNASAIPFAMAYSIATENPQPESMTLDGLAKNSAMLVVTMDKIGQSLFDVIFGQCKYSTSLGEAFQRSVDTVFCGSYQKNYTGAEEILSKRQEQRPSYSHLIFDAYSSHKKAG
ncbi:hypothetical protein [Simkania sp.]|uniref:hypothetical protein n=1 Tax=Simkania sp. TaxID=34094 RepID=UPI003B52BD60